MPDKFDVVGIIEYRSMDDIGRITIPTSIRKEMFGDHKLSAGQRFEIHYEKNTDTITLKRIYNQA